MILDNYAHRTEVRQALAGNQNWIDKYFGKILPMMVGQVNVGTVSMDRGFKPDVIHPDGQGTIGHSNREYATQRSFI